MTRHYIRLDPGFDEHKEAYPDGPYAALIGTLCLAESQPERGRFRSADYLRRLLGKRGRFVAYLVTQGDLVELPDGRMYVDGWDEWQEGDWKVAERVSRIRTRGHRNGAGNGASNGPVTPDVTVGVTVPVTALRQNGALRSGAVRSAAARRATPTPGDFNLKPTTTMDPQEERITFLLGRWSASVDTPSTRAVIAEELFGLGVTDPDAELANGTVPA